VSDSAPSAIVLTVSSSRAGGEGPEDVGGEELAGWAAGIGVQVMDREVVADRREEIEDRLRHFCDVLECDLVLTTGGTGLAPDDITPEATLAVAEREVPGIAEAMRLESREHTRHWMLARNRAVVRRGTLIVNFPGNPKAIGEAGAAIAEALPHALRLIAGEHGGH